ncbi:MAG: bifunctional glutamate N-acetyltransferase/amino-acid acetyltransferase ArgJ [Chthonomonadales bacterium]|nr:bifunctional glutamate N-acetyltransferase/amino-acid acetyltransferase ArgJ [Chthonomonadales bacterium]
MITRWKQTHDAGITYPEGFVASGVRCGLKTEGPDLALIVADGPASVAGVFTTNVVQAACVRYSKHVVERGVARAILCNAGNANACNGDRGDRDTISMAEMTARALGVEPTTVLIASTGVIGHPMPMEKLERGIPLAADALDREGDTDMRVARAIMTTDLRPKVIGVRCASDEWDGEIVFGGVCKGSGMIAPNMATMLCFLTADVRAPHPLLQDALREAVRCSFNRITVDGDTSTNDMALLMANGAGPCSIAQPGPAMDDFVEALSRVCLYLAREVARDGEGATKLVEVRVTGAPNEGDAELVARTIAESPLVKTALFGCDPNWGRILAAAGRSGIVFDPRSATVLIGDQVVYETGSSAPFDRDAAHDYLTEPEVILTLDLASGPASASVWTCDFSYDYVKINAEYHT